MVGEQNSITPSRAFFTIGEVVTHRRLAIGAGAQIAHADGAACLGFGRAALHLDKAHAAVAGDRQPLVVAKARHFGSRRLAGLKQRVIRRDIDFDAVNEEFVTPPLPQLQPAPRDFQR